MTPILPLVFAHSVASEGAPSAANCIVPEIGPSFITLGPATFTQLTLREAIADALACFSTRPSRSVSIIGRKLKAYCVAAEASPIADRDRGVARAAAGIAHMSSSF